MKMLSIRKLYNFFQFKRIFYPKRLVARRGYHGIPFLDLYERTTGESVTKDFLEAVKKKSPQIDTLSNDQIQNTLQVLKKFNISTLEACTNPHLFCMIPISMDNYGEILKECKFVKILPDHIIRYHTYVRSRTLKQLKHLNLLSSNLCLEETLYEYLKDLPQSLKTSSNFAEQDISVLTVRMAVLEKYLNWKLSVTREEFIKYCKNYLPIKHKPLADIQESLDIAQNVIKFETPAIRRNGFLLAADPMNTRLILQSVKSIAGYNICEVLKIEPAILKNNYNAILQIRDLLEEYRISVEAQRKCLKVFCMNPNTVKSRLEELTNVKEYQMLSTNPRMLSLVVHKKKMMTRLTKINSAKKQCYSLNHLITASKIFDSYISNFGNKICGRDLAVLISSSLTRENENQSEVVKEILTKLRRHKYWLHAALHVIDQNLQFLKKKFSNEVILNNCQILLYPASEIESYITLFKQLKNQQDTSTGYNSVFLDSNYSNLKCEEFDDSQILSLVLYEIEKKYHFSGDGMWLKQDTLKAEAQNS